MATLQTYMSANLRHPPDTAPEHARRRVYNIHRQATRKHSPRSGSKKRARSRKPDLSNLVLGSPERRLNGYQVIPRKPTTAMNYVFPTSTPAGRMLKNEQRMSYPATVSPLANVSCFTTDQDRSSLQDSRCVSGTEAENARIKAKLAEYEAMARKRYVTATTVCDRREDAHMLNAVSNNDLQRRFNLMAVRISSLLAKETPVEEVQPGEDKKVTMDADTRRHFKIYSRMQSVPLKLSIEIWKGVGSARFLFSQGVQRPNSENSDKAIPLKTREVMATYGGGGREGEKATFDDWVFFTIEADRPAVLAFQCVFGKGTRAYVMVDYFKRKARFRSEERLRAHERPNVPEPDVWLAAVQSADKEKNAEDPLDTFSPTQTQDKDTPAEKPRGRSQTNSRLQTRSGRRSCYRGPWNYEERRIHVGLMRERAEQADLQRKFLLIHRREINAQYVSCATSNPRIGGDTEREAGGADTIQAADAGVGRNPQIGRNESHAVAVLLGTSAAISHRG